MEEISKTIDCPGDLNYNRTENCLLKRSLIPHNHIIKLSSSLHVNLPHLNNSKIYNYAEKLNNGIPKCHYAFVGGTCHIYLIKTCMYQKPFLSGNAFVRVFYASALSIILLHMINNILTGIGFIMSKKICVLTCRKICDMFE